MTGRWRRGAVRWFAITASVAVLLWPALAPATITEQRARLPPPARCDDDPVEGVWKSHKHNPQWGDWTIFQLEIHRVDDTDQLTGTITNTNWSGGTQNEEPPGLCQPGQISWVVSMDARGRVTGDQIDFWGVGRWRLDRVVCERGPYGYNLDNFTGSIDHELQEFQSVNNDGGRAVNHPTVFRRVRCFPPEAERAPSVETTPPPFYPSRDRGCSL